MENKNQENEHQDEGQFETISTQMALDILDELEKEESEDSKYDTDLLIRFIKTIPDYQQKFEQMNKRELIPGYIQAMLDIMFYNLTHKYQYTWIYDTYLTNRLTAQSDAIAYFQSQEFQRVLEIVRSFKREFTPEFDTQYFDIDNSINAPGDFERILPEVLEMDSSDIQQESKSKFLKYWNDSKPERERLHAQFVDELIDALVFQYIFGVHVLGENFMEFGEQLAEEGSEISKPFDIKNPHLFGWAAKAKQPIPEGIQLVMIQKLPEIISQLQKYKERVAKNAVLNIIRSQFSNWTMMMNNDRMKARRQSTNLAVEAIRMLNEYGQKLGENPMDLEYESGETENEEFDKDHMKALMDFTVKNPIKGTYVLNEKYQEYDSETRTRKSDEIKPVNTFMQGILGRNIVRRTKELFEQVLKKPKKKPTDIIEELNK